MWRPFLGLCSVILTTLLSGGPTSAQELTARELTAQGSPEGQQQAVAIPTDEVKLQPAAPIEAVISDGSPRCQLQVRSLQSPFRGKFSATGILDLDFRALFREDFSGDHLLHFKIYTPKQHLYQTLTVPFSTSATRGGARLQVDGFPRPLVIQSGERVETTEGPRFAVTARLPVAGTSIVHSSLYGRWRVEAFLDDSTVACHRRQRRFLIVQ